MDSLIHAYTGELGGKVPASLLTPEQKELFHGFDEIGGDITMYEDAASWFKGVENEVEALTCCIIVLDKPTSWLFGGIKNEVKKAVQISYTKIGGFMAEYNNTESDDIKENLRTKIAAIVESDPNLALGENGNSINLACSLKSTVDSKLVRSMALLNDNDIESFDNDQLIKMKAVRMWWKGSLKLVNVSRMKRVAMMYLEMCPLRFMITPGIKWIKKHQGRPSNMEVYGTNAKTKEIMKADVEKFIKNKKYWKGFKKVFSDKLGIDVITNAHMDDDDGLSEKQLNFKSMCELTRYEVPDTVGEE
jgi:hypothetical protein